MTDATWPTPRLIEAREVYHELVDGPLGAQLREALAERIERYDLTLGGRPATNVLRPIFIDPQTQADAARASELVARAIATVAERLVRDEAFRRELGIPQIADFVLPLDLEAGRMPFVARLDALIDATGTARFLEYNPFPGGIDLNDELDEIYSGSELARAFRGRGFDFDGMKLRDGISRGLYRFRKSQGLSRPVAIAVPRLDGQYPFGDESRWLAWLAAHGNPVVHAPLDEFVLRDDGLYVGDHRVELVATTPFTALAKHAAEAAPIIEALQRGLAWAFFGLSRHMVSGKKTLFHVLSSPDHRSMFESDVAAALDRHVPWSRLVRDGRETYRDQAIDLLPFLADHRDQFVLKAVSGSGATGVTLGREVDDDAWKEALARAVESPHIVQERVDPIFEPYPYDDGSGVAFANHQSDYGPFIFEGQWAGEPLSRVTRELVTNIGRGGQIGVYWQVQ